MSLAHILSQLEDVQLNALIGVTIRMRDDVTLSYEDRAKAAEHLSDMQAEYDNRKAVREENKKKQAIRDAVEATINNRIHFESGSVHVPWMSTHQINRLVNNIMNDLSEKNLV